MSTFLGEDHTAILDGTSYLSSDSSVADPAKEQSAVQSPAQAYISVELLELKPVWWCVRGATGVLGDEPLSQFETDGRTVLHKGAACVLLEAKSRSANSSSQLLITRDGYLPVSYTRSVQGKPVTQLDIEYDRNSSPRLPIQWRAATRSPTGAAITESFEATVTSAEVGVAVPETAFKLTSPPGTIVVDTRQSDERKGPERVGVVLSDGTTSETVDRRGVKSYEELVAATRPRPARWPWIAAVVLATLAGAVGYWLAKRSQRTA